MTKRDLSPFFKLICELLYNCIKDTNMTTLSSLRKRKKLTQVACAKYLGIPVRTYQNYEIDESKSTIMNYKFTIQKLEKSRFIDETRSILSI